MQPDNLRGALRPAALPLAVMVPAVTITALAPGWAFFALGAALVVNAMTLFRFCGRSAERGEREHADFVFMTIFVTFVLGAAAIASGLGPAQALTLLVAPIVITLPPDPAGHTDRQAPELARLRSALLLIAAIAVAAPLVGVLAWPLLVAGCGAYALWSYRPAARTLAVTDFERAAALLAAAALALALSDDPTGARPALVVAAALAAVVAATTTDDEIAQRVHDTLALLVLAGAAVFAIELIKRDAGNEPYALIVAVTTWLVVTGWQRSAWRAPATLRVAVGLSVARGAACALAVAAITGAPRALLIALCVSEIGGAAFAIGWRWFHGHAARVGLRLDDRGSVTVVREVGTQPAWVMESWLAPAADDLRAARTELDPSAPIAAMIGIAPAWYRRLWPYHAFSTYIVDDSGRRHLFARSGDLASAVAEHAGLVERLLDSHRLPARWPRRLAVEIGSGTFPPLEPPQLGGVLACLDEQLAACSPDEAAHGAARALLATSIAPLEAARVLGARVKVALRPGTTVALTVLDR